MPVLKDFRRTKKISLSKHEGSEIEIYDGIIVKDAMGFNLENPQNANSLELIPKMIKDWNFTNEKEEKLPINMESLELLDMESLTELTNTINEFANLVKKKGLTNIAAVCLEMGWTERQYFEENSTNFLDELAFVIRQKYKKN